MPISTVLFPRSNSYYSNRIIMFLSGGCKAADGALTAAKAITRFGANTPAPSIPSGLLMSRVFRPKHRRLPRPTKKKKKKNAPSRKGRGAARVTTLVPRNGEKASAALCGRMCSARSGNGELPAVLTVRRPGHGEVRNGVSGRIFRVFRTLARTVRQLSGFGRTRTRSRP